MSPARVPCRHPAAPPTNSVHPTTRGARYAGHVLPTWSPRPPRDGWTLENSSAAAWDYAHEHAHLFPDVPPRVLADAAWRALAVHDAERRGLDVVDPGTLHRADMEDRLTSAPPAPGPDPLT